MTVMKKKIFQTSYWLISQNHEKLSAMIPQRKISRAGKIVKDEFGIRD